MRNIGILCVIAAIIFLIIGFALINVQRSSGQTANITATVTAPPTTIPTNTQNTILSNPYSPYTGSLVLNDPLRDNSRGYKWEEGMRDQGRCTFAGDSYHSIIPLAGYFHSCLATAMSFKDCAFEVQMNLISGSAGGIVFRANRATIHFYYFTVDRNGNYLLKSYYDKNAGATVLASGSGASLHGNDLIGVVARGSTISLYINQHLVGQVNNSDNADGQVGVVVYEGEAAFSDAKVWLL